MRCWSGLNALGLGYWRKITDRGYLLLTLPPTESPERVLKRDTEKIIVGNSAVVSSVVIGTDCRPGIPH